EGPLDLVRLRIAFGRVVERHAALRTTVDTDDGALVQRVRDYDGIDLPLVVAVGIDETSVIRGVLADLAGPFDLAGGSLLRARIVRLAPDRHLVLLLVHQLVFDSFSAQVLLRDLAAFYRGDGLPALATDYPSYALSRIAEPARRAGDLAYWRRILADATPLRLPTDRPRPAVADLAGAALVHDLDAGLGESVAAFSRQHRVTPFMTLVAAVGAVLGRFAGQQDLVLGTALSNRPAGTEDLIGLFADPVPLRLDLSGEPTLAELAARVRETTIDAVDHLAVGFDELVAELNPVRDPGRNPVFQVLVEYESTAELPFEPPALRAGLTDVPGDRAPFDL
ncbi:MAG: condensation domain-containing protein, partial [Nocardioidaceae bacterium]